MFDFTDSLIYAVVVLVGIFCCYSVPEICKRYFYYKEQALKENLKFQTEVESLKSDSFKEDIGLKIEEERTKQEQIRVAQEIAKKEREIENTKQLQIKAEFREKTGGALY